MVWAGKSMEIQCEDAREEFRRRNMWMDDGR
jgi:hypothetical protein